MALDPTSGVNELLQYGAVGALLIYFVAQDYFRNKRREQREDELQKAAIKRDEESKLREQECAKLNLSILARQSEVLEPLIANSNKLHEATLVYLKNLDGNPRVPRPFDDDETKEYDKG